MTVQNGTTICRNCHSYFIVAFRGWFDKTFIYGTFNYLEVVVKMSCLTISVYIYMRCAMIQKKSILLSLALLMSVMVTKPLTLFSDDVAIDLGTVNTLIKINDEIVADVPSCVAMDSKTGVVLYVGQEAKKMLGKTPEHIIAIRPMQDGVIKDFDVTQAMLEYIFEKAIGYQTGLLRGPRMVVGVPCSVTQPERRAIEDAAREAGARAVFTIMEPMAAAIGAGLPIEEPCGNMVMDIGGGTTDIVVISLKAPVVSHAVRMAGDAMDTAIVKYMKDSFSLIVGDQTAEKIKKDVGAVWLEEGTQGKRMTVGGADVMTGVPREVEVTSADVLKALEEPIHKILNAVRDVLNNTPPELASDIAARGILLVGGGSLVRGFEERIRHEFGLKVIRPENPLHAVIDGIGKVVENFDYYKEALTD